MSASADGSVSTRIAMGKKVNHTFISVDHLQLYFVSPHQASSSHKDALRNAFKGKDIETPVVEEKEEDVLAFNKLVGLWLVLFSVTLAIYT